MPRQRPQTTAPPSAPGDAGRAGALAGGGFAAAIIGGVPALAAAGGGDIGRPHEWQKRLSTGLRWPHRGQEVSAREESGGPCGAGDARSGVGVGIARRAPSVRSVMPQSRQ